MKIYTVLMPILACGILAGCSSPSSSSTQEERAELEYQSRIYMAEDGIKSCQTLINQALEKHEALVLKAAKYPPDSQRYKNILREAVALEYRIRTLQEMQRNSAEQLIVLIENKPDYKYMLVPPPSLAQEKTRIIRITNDQYYVDGEAVGLVELSEKLGPADHVVLQVNEDILHGRIVLVMEAVVAANVTDIRFGSAE